MDNRFDNEIKLPEGIDLFELRSFLEIKYDGQKRRKLQRRNPGDVFGRIFVIIWSMLWVGMPLIQMGIMSLVFTFIPLLFVLRNAFKQKQVRDRTRIKSATIQVNPYRINIKKKYARGLSRLKEEEIQVEDIEEFIVERKRGQFMRRASFANIYTLKAKLCDGNVVDILDDIDTYQQANFIKERIVAFMNKDEDLWLDDIGEGQLNAPPINLDLDKDVKGRKGNKETDN